MSKGSKLGKFSRILQFPDHNSSFDLNDCKAVTNQGMFASVRIHRFAFF